MLIMKKFTCCLFLFFTLANFAQIKGTVTDDKGNPLPAVSVFIESTFIGTTTNENGQYQLKPKDNASHVIVFQYLGFKTKKINTTSVSQTIDVQLSEENITLNEVIIRKSDNPANGIIRNAIASKKENTEKMQKYEASFYSRGIFRIKNAPKKIMGQKFDNFDEVLDSTRSGILYLSETFSHIAIDKPDKFKETIIASKVSGDDNGFSFNSAEAANFDFYENYVKVQINVISPIANNAFNYYRYKFEGSFFDENNQQINKIKVTPRRQSEPAMEGYIYIADDSWAIYAVDLSVRGEQIQNPAMTTLTVKQNFNYNSASKTWVKNSQTLDFGASLLGIVISGRLTYVYSDYVFKTEFAKRTFKREVLSFEDNANKKDSLYWNALRPIPLTAEEATDYLKKDVLQTKKKSKTYLDSIDTKGNKFKIFDVILGYTHTNSFKNAEFKYKGLLKGIGFNTIQGWTLDTGFEWTKENEENRTYSGFSVHFNYGFAEEKFRPDFCYINKFSNLNQSEIKVCGGSMVAQFNPNEPISNIINSISTLFFKDNYMKLFERNYANIFYKREVINGLVLDAAIDYSERKPLFNNTDYVLLKRDKLYTSNNPLAPYDYVTPAITKHNLAKAIVNAKVTFGQKYWSRPDGKFNIRDNDYPVIHLGYEKGFAGSDKKYEYDLVNARLHYDVMLGNKGHLEMQLKAGKFYNANAISFTDFYHPNGNLTHIGQTPDYLNVFNLLPYYAGSTNDSYFEAHAEHNDKGYIMNKLPLLSKLKSTLVLGYHNLSIPNRNPYHEFSVGLDNLGFGKFKLFRVDYVRSYQNGYQGDGVIFGLKFLDLLK
jgi:hypothetical protein